MQIEFLLENTLQIKEISPAGDVLNNKNPLKNWLIFYNLNKNGNRAFFRAGALRRFRQSPLGKNGFAVYMYELALRRDTSESG